MYEQKAITTTIRATSRASVKIDNDFYTLEYCEERTIPDTEDVDLETEKKILWDDVNREVDHQIDDVWQAVREAKEARKKNNR